MIIPERPELLTKLANRVKKNQETGDWGPPQASTSVFIPLNQTGKLFQEADAAND